MMSEGGKWKRECLFDEFGGYAYKEQIQSARSARGLKMTRIA